MNNEKRNLKSRKQETQQDYKRAYEFVRALIGDGQLPDSLDIREYCGVSSNIAIRAIETYLNCHGITYRDLLDICGSWE